MSVEDEMLAAGQALARRAREVARGRAAPLTPEELARVALSIMHWQARIRAGKPDPVPVRRIPLRPHLTILEGGRAAGSSPSTR